MLEFGIRKSGDLRESRSGADKALAGQTLRGSRLAIGQMPENPLEFVVVGKRNHDLAATAGCLLDADLAPQGPAQFLLQGRDLGVAGSFRPRGFVAADDGQDGAILLMQLQLDLGLDRADTQTLALDTPAHLELRLRPPRATGLGRDRR